MIIIKKLDDEDVQSMLYRLATYMVYMEYGILKTQSFCTPDRIISEVRSKHIDSIDKIFTGDYVKYTNDDVDEKDINAKYTMIQDSRTTLYIPRSVVDLFIKYDIHAIYDTAKRDILKEQPDLRYKPIITTLPDKFHNSGVVSWNSHVAAYAETFNRKETAFTAKSDSRLERYNLTYEDKENNIQSLIEQSVIDGNLVFDRFIWHIETGPFGNNVRRNSVIFDYDDIITASNLAYIPELNITHYKIVNHIIPHKYKILISPTPDNSLNLKYLWKEFLLHNKDSDNRYENNMAVDAGKVIFDVPLYQASHDEVKDLVLPGHLIITDDNHQLYKCRSCEHVIADDNIILARHTIRDIKDESDKDTTHYYSPFCETCSMRNNIPVICFPAYTLEQQYSIDYYIDYFGNKTNDEKELIRLLHSGNFVYRSKINTVEVGNKFMVMNIARIYQVHYNIQSGKLSLDSLKGKKLFITFSS